MPEEEPLYDIIIPPGVPQKLIVDISKKFDVTVVDEKKRSSLPTWKVMSGNFWHSAVNLR